MRRYEVILHSSDGEGGIGSPLGNRLAITPLSVPSCSLGLRCRTLRLFIASFWAYFWRLCDKMAEKEGFEPPVPLPAQLISSQSHSATLALLH